MVILTQNQSFEGCWLMNLNFVIIYGWKLPKTVSKVFSSVYQSWYLWKNSKWTIFRQKMSKMVILTQNQSFKNFWPITSNFVITYDWNLPKIISKYCLACISSGKWGKIQNQRLFGQKCQKWPSWPIIQVLKLFGK